jgi:YVTN family beta-propeller protein
MPLTRITKLVAVAFAGASALAGPALQAQLNTGAPQILSTNQTITPLAPAGATFQALYPLTNPSYYSVGQAVSTALSPNGKTLLILTSGYNLYNYVSGPNQGSPIPNVSTEWVFVFDVSGAHPVQKQVISVPNTYNGVVWSPSGTEFFVSGGDNDNVHIYSAVNNVYAEEAGSPVALGHLPGLPPINDGGLGLITPPEAAGLAVSADGNTVIVADYENDSITTLTKTNNVWAKSAELDLRPGKENSAQTGVPGGEYPFWVQIAGNTAYISSVRDRQIVVVQNNAVVARIAVPGQPNKMVLNKAQSLLYVAQDNSNFVEVIDTANNVVVDQIQVAIPAQDTANNPNFLGANPNSVTLSPDESTLYVTDGGLNAVAVVSLGGLGQSHLLGMIPTGFYPNALSVSADGKTLFIVNGKSATGPNKNCSTAVPGPATNLCNAANQYDLQLTKAGFQTVPVPNSSALSTLTAQVLQNDNLGRQLTPNEQTTMSFLQSHIQHVVYIIKENRTYDQVLGDLTVGNGDPHITQFGAANTPNFHALAKNFVDFDNFYDVSDVSGDGWPWSTSARSTDVIEKEIPVNYAGRGIDNDSEGTNRNLNVAIANPLTRFYANPLDGTFTGTTFVPDYNLLPGNANVAAPDDDNGGLGQGYLWNGALKAGLTVRDYGMFIDISRYNLTAVPSLNIPELTNPAATSTVVATSTNTVLSPYTDPYYRGFDNTFPDYYRFTEWNREFQQYVTNGNLPSLSLVRLMHDHFGNFSVALNGVNTPELQIADNDYAVGLLIQTVANSPYAGNTLIFVIEDDAQDGGDHVDAHRSTAFVVGPYVKQGYVDATRYNTVSMVATMEHILGIAPLNLNDANAAPMADAFNIGQTSAWTYTATPSLYLANTTLPIPQSAYALNKTGPLYPLHNGAWWAAKTKSFDFAEEDHLDSAKFNALVWRGVMGNKPYPSARSGADLRENRDVLLAKLAAKQAPKGQSVKAATAKTRQAAVVVAVPANSGTR